MDQVANMTAGLIAHAEKLFAQETHPAELARRQKVHKANLLDARNDYVNRCHAENGRYLLELMRVVNEHDVKNMGAEATPTYETIGYDEDMRD